MTYRQFDSVAVAAAKASISRATAYRIEADPVLPSQTPTPRGRRRPDPLAGIFDEEVVPILALTPDIRPVALFDELMRRAAMLDHPADWLVRAKHDHREHSAAPMDEIGRWCEDKLGSGAVEE